MGLSGEPTGEGDRLDGHRAATEWLRLIYVPSETEMEARTLLCTVSDKLAQLIQLSGLILHFWTRHILHCFHSQVLFLGTE